MCSSSLRPSNIQFCMINIDYRKVAAWGALLLTFNQKTINKLDLPKLVRTDGKKVFVDSRSTTPSSRLDYSHKDDIQYKSYITIKTDKQLYNF